MHRNAITQWHIYALPDGAEVYALKSWSSATAWRWQFYRVTPQPPIEGRDLVAVEDDQRPGSLRSAHFDPWGNCWRITDSDLTFDDLRPTGRTHEE